MIDHSREHCDSQTQQPDGLSDEDRAVLASASWHSKNPGAAAMASPSMDDLTAMAAGSSVPRTRPGGIAPSGAPRHSSAMDPTPVPTTVVPGPGESAVPPQAASAPGADQYRNRSSAPPPPKSPMRSAAPPPPAPRPSAPPPPEEPTSSQRTTTIKAETPMDGTPTAVGSLPPQPRAPSLTVERSDDEGDEASAHADVPPQTTVSRRPRRRQRDITPTSRGVVRPPEPPEDTASEPVKVTKPVTLPPPPKSPRATPAAPSLAWLGALWRKRWWAFLLLVVAVLLVGAAWFFKTEEPERVAPKDDATPVAPVATLVEAPTERPLALSPRADTDAYRLRSDEDWFVAVQPDGSREQCIVVAFPRTATLPDGSPINDQWSRCLANPDGSLITGSIPGKTGTYAFLCGADCTRVTH